MVVLFEFLLILPLVRRDETLVFLHGLTAPEMGTQGLGGWNEVVFCRSLKCLEVI